MSVTCTMYFKIRQSARKMAAPGLRMHRWYTCFGSFCESSLSSWYCGISSSHPTRDYFLSYYCHGCISALLDNTLISFIRCDLLVINPLTPNDPYRGRTAPLTSKRCILYIYSTYIDTEYFKHGIYSPFFPLQNAVCFIILTYLVPVLFTFCVQSVLKLKK